MRIYIAGKITGELDYKEKFKKAEDKLKEMGHIVVNPTMLPDGLGAHRDYMDICITMLGKCDAIYLLKGYEGSPGAMQEAIHAYEHNKRIFYEEKALQDGNPNKANNK